MSYRIVWKLCERSKGKLCSAVAYGDDVMVYYSIGKSTKPKLGLLFAFDTKENAIKAIPTVSNDSIVVRCKARISKRPVPEYVAFFEYYKEYWDCLFGKTFNEYNNSSREMPIGTVFCTQVIPIEVEEEK